MRHGSCGHQTIFAIIGFVAAIFFTGGTASGVGISTLNVAKGGTGTGAVTSTPVGIDCGTHCAKQFSDDTTVTLTALADSGSNFVGWTGCNAVGAITCDITMTWDATVTATFEIPVTLNVTRTGTGSGVVTGDPGGISCGSACSASYWPSESTIVTLTATADPGSTFTGWTGCGSVSGSTCIVAMTAAASVSAGFARDSTVAVLKTGTGSGSVTSYPPGISCGLTCSHLFDGGTSVTLVAVADANSTFQGWTGCDSASGTACYISISGNITPTAQFGDNSALRVVKTGNGTGRVTSSPAGISCGTVCSKEYAPGTAVTLTAAPDDHVVFTGWIGCPAASGATCAITMTADVTVSAQFTAGNVLTIEKTGVIGTGVYSYPAGVACWGDCTAATGTFVAGQDVTLHAASTNGSMGFAYWTGDCEGTRSCKITLDRDLWVGAVFVPTKGRRHVLAIAKTRKNAGDGIVESMDESLHCGSSCRNSYYSGTSMVLTATADPGSTFMGWTPASLKCPGTDPCALTMYSAKMVRAVFVGPQKLTARKQHLRGGNGTILSDPEGIDFGLYGTSAQALFPLDTEVMLTATADTGSEFSGWKPASLGCAGTDPCVLTMDKAKTATAVFAKPKSTLKSYVDDED